MPRDRRNKVCSLSGGRGPSFRSRHMSLCEKTSSSSRHLPRRNGMGRNETRRDETRRETGRKRGDASKRTADEEKQRPPRSRKLNPPTRRWVGRPWRAVSINKQKLSCYRCEGERFQVDRITRHTLHGNRPWLLNWRSSFRVRFSRFWCNPVDTIAFIAITSQLYQIWKYPRKHRGSPSSISHSQHGAK